MERLIYRLKQSIILQIFTISLRYVLGASFVYASIFKIEGRRFMELGQNEPMDGLAKFFEAMYQSSVYWHFIGWGQLMAGCLLMSQMFSTLGAVAFFSIMLNIFVITISFQSVGILTITFLMLLANIYLLLWDWNKLKFVALPNPQNYIDDNAAFTKRNVWTYLGISYFFIVVLIRKGMIRNPSLPLNLVLWGSVLIALLWIIIVFFQFRKK